MKVSVVVPLYNEEASVGALVSRVSKVLGEASGDWELILVDDGSTDGTLKLLREQAKRNSYVKVFPHGQNMGQGRALRTGFAVSTGDIIVTLDADLTYDPSHILRLIDTLAQNKAIEIAIGSPYMRKGKTEGIPFLRLLLSKVANRLLGFALPGRLHTVTGMLRAYRRPVLNSLELESDGKEIHFEILSKALATGFRVVEIPATLTWRKHGVSKIRIPVAILSHLLFSFFEKPALLFSFLGLILFILGIVAGIYIIFLWQTGELDPTRPLMILMVLLLAIGAIVFSFGFISSQIVQLRKEIYRIQRENLELANRMRGHQRDNNRLEK